MLDHSVNLFFIVDCSQRSLKAAPLGEPRQGFPKAGLPEPCVGGTVERLLVGPWDLGTCVLLKEHPGRRMGGCDSHPPSTKSETRPFSKLSHTAGKNERLLLQRTLYIRDRDKAQPASLQDWCPKMRNPEQIRQKPLHKRTGQAGPTVHELQSIWEVLIVPHLWKRLITNPGKTS